jgi:hypothetical protein
MKILRELSYGNLRPKAEEKSLERKLGQSQKRNFRFTNKQEDACEVRNFTLRFVMR